MYMVSWSEAVLRPGGALLTYFLWTFSGNLTVNWASEQDNLLFFIVEKKMSEYFLLGRMTKSHLWLNDQLIGNESYPYFVEKVIYTDDIIVRNIKRTD